VPGQDGRQVSSPTRVSRGAGVMDFNYLVGQFPPSPHPFPHKEGRGANARRRFGSPSLFMGEGFRVGVDCYIILYKYINLPSHTPIA